MSLLLSVQHARLLTFSLVKYVMLLAFAAGGRGGSIAVNDAYIAVINTTLVGSTASSSPNATKEAQQMKTALNGGCMALDSSTLYVVGSSFSRCIAHYLGGAISMLKVTSVFLDSSIDSSTADQVRWFAAGHIYCPAGLFVTGCIIPCGK
jgi:hypothetical protein